MRDERTLPQVDESLCTLCGLCVEACGCKAVTLGERGPVFNCPDACGSWAKGCSSCCSCEDVCPTGAISLGFCIVTEDPRNAHAAPAS